MKYDFKTYVCRDNTGAHKTNEEKIKQALGYPYYEDTIPMWIADMDFACSPEIKERLVQRVNRDIFGYTGITKEYLDSIVDWYKRRYHTLIDKSWIVYSNGTVRGLKNAILAYTKEGDNIIVQSPVYTPFFKNVSMNNRVVLENKLYKDENNIFHIDLDDFKEKCKDAKMFILCHPHNPTGNIWDKEVLQQLIDIARENHVIVFSDEVHSDLIRCCQCFTSALSLDNNDHVVVATAVNKTFNLAGLHATNLIIKNKELREKLTNFTGSVSMSPFTLEATIAAYNDSEEWLDELKVVLDENFNFVQQFLQLNLPKVKFQIPNATYLAWLDFSEYHLSQDDLMVEIVENAHVLLENGKSFGEAGEGFVRMNIACPKEVLEEALWRLVKVFKNK